MVVVSVIIPTFNRGHLLKKTIDSVLIQTYQNFEIIIIDDGSTDNSEEIVCGIRDERIKYIKHGKNKGPSAARNTGIKSAKGKYIAFLDSDVIWLRDKLEKQVNILNSSTPDVGVVFGGVQYIDYKTQEYLTQWIIEEDVNEKIFNSLGCAPDTPTMLVKKEALIDVGLFDERIPAHEETELGIRLAKKYKFIPINECLIISTMNHEQISRNKDSFIIGKEFIYEKHKDVLTKDFSYDLCNIIAGDCIYKGNFRKGKLYLIKALKIKPYKIKTIISLLLCITVPRLDKYFYNVKYKFLYEK